MGSWAGPVVAAAVIFPPEANESELAGINDSKRLTPASRERLCAMIVERALASAVGIVEVEEIDLLNVLAAALLAMRRAVEALPVRPQFLLIDGRGPSPVPGLPYLRLVGGDSDSVSIAAASIVAKVTRDKFMCHYDQRYPGYGFAEHKGYGTRKHLEALRQLGVSPIHRKSFSPVAALCEK